MRLYLHLQESPPESEAEISVVVSLAEDELTLANLKEKFVEIVARKHARTLQPQALTLYTARGKAIGSNAELKKNVSDKDDVFVRVTAEVQPKQASAPEKLAQVASPVVNQPGSKDKPTLVPKQAPPAVAESSDDSAQSHPAISVWEVGPALLAEKNFEALESAMTNAIFEDPTTPHPYFWRAQARVGLSLPLLAIEDLNRCLILEPSHQRAFLLKIPCLLMLKDFAAARALCRVLRLLIAQTSSDVPEPWHISAPEMKDIATLQTESETKLIQKRRAADTNFKTLDATFESSVLAQSLMIIKQILDRGQYDQARPAILEILDIEPMQRDCLLFMADIYSKAGKWTWSVEFLTRATLYHPNDTGIRERLAEAFDATHDYGIAASLWASSMKLSPQSSMFPAKTRQIDILAKLAHSLRRAGETEASWNLFVRILKQDDDNQAALLGYALTMMDQQQFDESCKVALRLLIKDTKNETVRELLADSIRHPKGYSFLMDQLKQVPNPASGMAFVAVTIKDWGAVKEAALLYEECLKEDPGSAAFCLNYIHTLEVLNQNDRAFQAVREFCRKNPKRNVGPLTCAHIYNAISGVDDVMQFRSWLPDAPSRKAADPSRLIAIDESNLPAALQLDQMYNDTTLDLLAVFCTLVKLSFSLGALEIITELIKLIHPVRDNRPIHTTTIRNEHAYYCCIAQLMETIKLPLVNTNTIYVAGDSHSMSPAWRTLTLGGAQHTIQPLLVTGMKCWHLRPESKFYPKNNFFNVVPTAPEGSKIIMLFGEIDCREGFLVSVQKCRYENIEEAAAVTVNIYIDTLLKLQEEKKYELYIHPVVPVIDITRPIVTVFNQVLKKRVLEIPSLHWLEFFDELLTVPDRKLKKEYELDGTHMNPAYLSLVEREMQRYF